MDNRNEDEGSFRGHGLNRQNQIGDLHLGYPGISFTEALLQPRTHNLEAFHQWQTETRGGPYSQQLSRSSADFMPRYSQGSLASSSHVLPELDMSVPHFPNPPTLSEDQTPTNGRGGNWSVAEDEMLCNAWVYVSTDPITRDSQKKTTFWRRVFEDFVHRHGENDPVTRNQKTCDQRFQHIRAECNKWSAACKKIMEHPKSGQNAVDAVTFPIFVVF
ncbi:hypothetical protein Droror1_Dr00014250 [Drosera rotundifolia]